MSDFSQDPQDQNQAAPVAPRNDDVQPGANPKKLFVGNLSWSMGNEDLQQVFAEYGTVEEAFVLTDKFSGRSKGFGFVTMSSAEEALAAVEGLHQHEVGGRQIVVNVAQPPKPRDDWSRGGSDRRPSGDRNGFGNDRRGGFGGSSDRRGGAGGNFRRGR